MDAMLSMFLDRYLDHVFGQLSAEAEKRELERRRPRFVGSGEVFVCLERDSGWLCPERKIIKSRIA